MSKKYNITDTRAAAFPIPTKGQAIYWDEKQSGLGLRVTVNGARSWIVQGYVNGKSKRFTLGLLDELDYKEAREEASSTRASMRKGVNPLEEKMNELMDKIPVSIYLCEEEEFSLDRE